MRESRVFFLLILTLASLSAACRRQLALKYEYDAFGFVETAVASSGGSVVAVARKVGMRSVGGPTVTDIEVEETHFEAGTQRVLYKGTITFRCRTNEPFGEPVAVRALSGRKPYDVFERWPYATTPLGFGP